MSTSSLWVRIGDIDSLGDPESYNEQLCQALKSLGSVSTMSIADSQGRELVFSLSEDGEYLYRETNVDDQDSLVLQRRESNVGYMNLSDVGDYSTFFGDYPVWFRMSRPYLLPDTQTLGSTITASLGDWSAGNGINIWLDLPTTKLARAMEPMEKYEDALVFLLLPGDEFLIFSVDELMRHVQIGSPSNVTWQPDGGAGNDRELLASALDRAALADNPEGQELVFNYDNKPWRADFRTLSMGAHDIQAGTFIPVDSLWTADVYLPLQVAVAAILLFVGTAGFVIIRDFQRNASKTSEEEILHGLISGGESADLEFKSSLRWDYRQDKVNKDLETVILKSVAAFSNASGGTLLIGVDDDGVILGLDRDYSCLKDSGKDYFELHLRSLLSSRYGAETASRGVTIDFLEIDAKEICRVQVAKGKRPLYTPVPSKNGGVREKFYIRSGNSSRAVETLAEITSYVFGRFGKRAVE